VWRFLLRLDFLSFGDLFLKHHNEASSVYIKCQFSDYQKHDNPKTNIWIYLIQQHFFFFSTLAIRIFRLLPTKVDGCLREGDPISPSIIIGESFDRILDIYQDTLLKGGGGGGALCKTDQLRRTAEDKKRCTRLGSGTTCLIFSSGKLFRCPRSQWYPAILL